MAATSADRPSAIRVLISSLWGASRTFLIEVRNAFKFAITPDYSTDGPERLFGFVHNLKETDVYIAVQINDRTQGELARDIEEYQTWVGPVHAATGFSELEIKVRADIMKHPDHRWLILQSSQIAAAMASPVEFRNLK